MALTQPFINTISAFDALIGTTIDLNILGGDAITSYQFFIYDNLTNNLIYTSSEISISDDVASISVRTFPMLIGAGLGGIVNNGAYKISVQTFNLTISSSISDQVIFNCYITPSIKMQQFLVDEYVDIENYDIVTSDKPSIQLVFDANDLNSIATLNYAQITLYGVKDGDISLINTGEYIYNSPYQQEVEGFSRTIDSNGDLLVNRKYDTFMLEVYAYTIENFEIHQAVTGLSCQYTIIENSPYINVYNLCDEGLIKITSTLTSYQGTSNPTPPTYIDEEEIDLTGNGTWAKWQNFFNLQQPYTYRLWARAFNVGIISTLISNATGNSIQISYNDDGVDTYISLSYTQLNYLGEQMYPYYIESDKIDSSLIDENTVLFIGIQQNGNLFNLYFQIIT